MPTLADTTERFLQEVAAQRSLRPNTLRAYRSDLAVAVASLPGSLEQITPPVISAFLRQGHGSALIRRAAVLRRFFDWAVEQGLCAANPLDGQQLSPASRPVRQRADLSERDRATIAEVIDRAPQPYRLIFTLIYEGGLSPGEVLGLTGGDLTIEGDVVRVVLRGTAGAHDRVVALHFAASHNAFADLSAWLAHFRQTTVGAPLFLSNRGTPLSYDALHYQWERLSLNAGLVDGNGKPRYSLLQLREANQTRSEPPPQPLPDPTAAYPLLATKLSIPRERATLVPRPRLDLLLQQGLRRRLTAVVAPAGFGKTTLVSDFFFLNKWAGQAQPPEQAVPHVAWVTLDADDNDPVRFWSYVITALQGSTPALGRRAMEQLHTPQPPPVESVLVTVVNELAELRDEHVLVLDDVHQIVAPAIHRALAFFVEHLPPHVHLVLLSRADPPMPLTRLRTREQLMEIRSAQLRFTSEEATVFLNQVMGLRLPPETIGTLEARTEGWIAGLQLAALSLHGRHDVQDFVAAFAGSHRYVVDYLADEVLKQLPADLQSFLLVTSLLDRLTAPLCDAVTLRTDSQSVLDQLERSSLFILPLDDERRWYRYHQLFAEFLRATLRQTRPNDIAGIHRRAMVWYEQNGFPAEAVAHALAVSDFPYVARLITGSALSMLQHGEAATLLNWLKALPESLVRAQPVISLIYAWVLVATGQWELATARLHDAERSLGAGQVSLETADESHDLSIQAHIAALRSTLALVHGNISSSLDYAQQALDYGSDDVLLRVIIAQNQAIAYGISGNLAAAQQSLIEASDSSTVGGNLAAAAASLCTLAMVQFSQGRLHQAHETYQQAQRLLAANEWPSPIRVQAYIGLCRVFYEWNDLDRLEQVVNDGLQASELSSDSRVVLVSSIIRAGLQQARGDSQSVRELMARFAQLLPDAHLPPLAAIQLSAFNTRMALAQGMTELAAEWADQWQRNRHEAHNPVFELGHLTFVRFLLHQHQPEEALHWLAQLLPLAETTTRTASVIEILALQAIAFQANNQTKRALAVLERAITLAEPEGYVRTFVDLGAPMADLLRMLLKHRYQDRSSPQRSQASYLTRLLNAYPAQRAEPTTQSKSSSGTADVLTEREEKVLQLLAQGYSGREIAEALVIAPGTVKRHLHNIYGKLGVQSRTQAIARAQGLGLLAA